MASGSPAPVLVVTNDFPPRAGGIERYAERLVRALPGGAVVLTRAQPGAAGEARELDAELARGGVRVQRLRAPVLLPTPGLAARAAAAARAAGARSAWFPAAAPLAQLAPALRRAGVARVVASTHGHEVWWARLPASRELLAAALAGCDAATVLGPATAAPVRAGLARALPGRTAAAAAGVPLVELPPAVEAAAFDRARPAVAAAAAAVRQRWRLGGRPVVVCVSRLVPRKGQDVLVRAWPRVRAAVPGAVLLLVGTGPRERALRRLAARTGSAVGAGGDVVLTGGVGEGELAGCYAAADLFAMPARDRRGGLEVEGLGTCYLEAAAAGLASVAGRSGGTAQAVVDGTTGVLVDGADPAAVARAVVDLLLDRERAAAMAAAGRARVLAGWTWPARAGVLAALLDPDRPVPA